MDTEATKKGITHCAYISQNMFEATSMKGLAGPYLILGKRERVFHNQMNEGARNRKEERVTKKHCVRNKKEKGIEALSSFSGGWLPTLLA